MSADQLTALNNLFGNVIDPKDFAILMRDFRESAISMYLEREDPTSHQQVVREGFLWLGELIEILDPKA